MSLSPLSHIEKIQATIHPFGWEKSGLLNDRLLNAPGYSDFLSLLYQSRLLFSIRAYQVSSDHPGMSQGIQIIQGEPHLFKEGNWTRWDEIVRDLRYDPARKEIVEKSNPNQCWNYFYPKGLVPQTRYNWVGPIHKASKQEMNALHAQGSKFSTGGAHCNRYLQVISRGKTPLDQIGGHIGVRLIDEDGSLYSLGFEIPAYEADLKTKTIFNTLSTYNVSMASLDFTEFKKFDVKRITTIPLTEEAFTRIIEKVKRYAQTPLRLNFLNQNCIDLAIDLLDEAGVPVSAKTDSVAKTLSEVFLPPMEKIPLLGPVVAKTRHVARQLIGIVPIRVKKVVRPIVRGATFLPRLLLTVLKNISFLILGAGKEGVPLKKQKPTQDRLSVHTPPFSRWSDLFKDIPISEPVEMVKWQEKQPSTHIHHYEGPRFYF